MLLKELGEVPLILRRAVMRALSAQHDGDLFEADMLFAQIVRRQPVHPLLASVAGDFRLLKGDFSGAWDLVERRLELHYYTHRPFMQLLAPMWSGEPIPDARLLIFCDLGLGDSLLLARFLPWVQGRVGALALQVNPGTADFWRYRLPDVAFSEIGDPLPECDFRINMFCLPRLFGADADTIPPAGYIHPCEQERDFWRARLGRKDGLKVGVTWQGNPDHARDFERSIPFDRLLPLITDHELAAAGVHFYSTQLHHGREATAELAAAGKIEDLGNEILARDPLEATAALIEELDIVIAVDTAIANLAGAMGRPFWLPTYKVPDWRWQIFPNLELSRPETAPWYESARVFACPERQDWDAVIEDMRAELKKISAA